MQENHICPRCQSSATVKAGFARSKPRRKCKECGRQFIIGSAKGVDVKKKIHALLLYMSGVSIRRIAFLSDVSHVSVIKWIKMFGEAFGEKPDFPLTEGVEIELDEMWHYLKKKLKNYGFGKLIAEQAVVSSIGNAVIVTVSLSGKCIAGSGKRA